MKKKGAVKKVRAKRHYRRWILFAFIAISLMSAAMYQLYMAFRVRDGAAAATVNNHPVSVRMLRQKMSGESAKVFDYFKSKYGVDDSRDFWTNSYGGEVPVEVLRKKALDACVRIQVQLMLAEREGLIADTSYAWLLEEMKKENRGRKQKAANGEIFYGPVRLDEEQYMRITLSKLAIALRQKLEAEELSFTEEDLRNFYEKNREKLYTAEDYIKVRKIIVPGFDERGRTNPEWKAEARKRILEAKALLDRGESFETIAMQYNPENSMQSYGEQVFSKESREPGGGDSLRGFAETLQPGQTGEIVEANDIFYILKCMERRPGEAAAFDEVRDAVKNEYLSGGYEAWIDSLAASAGVSINTGVYERIMIR